MYKTRLPAAVKKSAHWKIFSGSLKAYLELAENDTENKMQRLPKRLALFFILSIPLHVHQLLFYELCPTDDEAAHK